MREFTLIWVSLLQKFAVFTIFYFIVSHSLQFEAAARAQAAANPNLRHIGGPLGPAQMLAMAQSREVQQEKDARTLALLQYQEALMRAGQPPLPSGPMAVAGNYFSYKITYSAHWILQPWMQRAGWLQRPHPCDEHPSVDLGDLGYNDLKFQPLCSKIATINPFEVAIFNGLCLFVLNLTIFIQICFENSDRASYSDLNPVYGGHLLYLMATV